MGRSAEVTRLWARTFGRTHVITVDGREARVQRLIETLPFEPSLLTIDNGRPGVDCLSGRAEANHHVVVGNRHKAIVAAARRDALKNVCVFEDDAEFVDEEEDALCRALRWIDAHPNRWDVFYLGYLAPILTASSRVAPSIVRPRRPFHAHALAFHSGIYAEILAIDFVEDHRPPLFRAMERLISPQGRREPYFRDGVGSLDSWLAFSRTRRFAVHPIQVVQTSLPPGTEEGWERRTGRRYSVHGTPRTLARLALLVHDGEVVLVVLVLALLLFGASRC